MLAAASGACCHRDWIWIPEDFLAKAMCAGLVIGSGIGVAALRIKPRWLEWTGPSSTAFITFVSCAASAVVMGLGAYRIAQLPRPYGFD